MTLKELFDRTNRFLNTYNYVVLAAGVGLVVATMIFRVPPRVMDVLIALNLCVSCLLLFCTLSITRAVQLSAFPSVLLLATLFRLALNVSTTRLILLEANAGQIIFEFGNLVVGGNFVVGAAVFLVLTIIQFLVIAKGADRAAEVAARFTLDAMAGKQMAIDSDLDRGRIKPDEARARRAELETENNLFAAMSGATKFVQGDAIAGLIILAVNIVGGLIVGVMQKGMSFPDAARLYSILTIGDGLVSQIPALIISLAAAIIITRVSTDQPGEAQPGLGRDVLLQALAHPQALFVLAATLTVMAFAIGPWEVFLVLAALAVLAGFFAVRLKKEAQTIAQESVAAADGSAAPAPAPPAGPLALAVPGQRPAARTELPTPVVVEFSRVLDPLLFPEQPEARQSNADRAAVVRQKLRDKHGFDFPAIVFLREAPGPPRLPSAAFALSFGTTRLEVGVLAPTRLIACTSVAEAQAAGVAATPYPAGLRWYGREFALVDIADVPRLRDAKIEVRTPLDCLFDAITVTLDRNAAEFCGVQEIANRVEALREVSKDLVESVVDKMFTLPEIAEIASRLLRENIPVRDFRLLLEALSEWRGKTTDPLLVTEHVRSHMKLLLTGLYAQPFGRIVYMTLNRDAELTLDRAYEPDASRGPSIAFSEEEHAGLRQSITAVRSKARQKFPGCRPILLVPPANRYAARLAVQSDFPDLPVLSRDEIAPGCRIEFAGAVSTEAQPAGVS